MKFTLHFTLVFCALFFSKAKDVLHFDVLLFGNKIGQMTVSRHIHGDTLLYTLESYSKARVLWMDYEDISYMKVKYVKDKIHSIYYYEDLNKKRKYFTYMTYDGKQYTVTTKNGTRTIVPENYPSLLSLYFNEPVNISKIYFEAQLFATPLERIQPGHYVFKTKEGNENEYIYRNGQIDELIFHTQIATVKMKRVFRE
jgi:hypothetical protein